MIVTEASRIGVNLKSIGIKNSVLFIFHFLFFFVLTFHSVVLTAD